MAEGGAAEAAASEDQRPFGEVATAGAVQEWAGQTRLGAGPEVGTAHDAEQAERVLDVGAEVAV